MWECLNSVDGIKFVDKEETVDLTNSPISVIKVEDWGDVVIKIDGIDGCAVVMMASGMVKVPLEYNDLIPLRSFKNWFNRVCK